MNPLLEETIQANESKVDPDMKNTYQKIVLAGEKVMYAPQMQGMLASQLKSTPNIAEAVGEGIAKLFGILMNKSKNTLNMKAAIPAMTTLMCKALDFVEEGGAVEVTPELLSETTKEMGSALLQILGATPDKIRAMKQQQAGGIPSGNPSRAPVGGLMTAGG